MLATELGMMMLVKPLHPWNVSYSIFATELGMLTFVKFLHR